MSTIHILFFFEEPGILQMQPNGMSSLDDPAKNYVDMINKGKHPSLKISDGS